MKNAYAARTALLILLGAAWSLGRAQAEPNFDDPRFMPFKGDVRIYEEMFDPAQPNKPVEKLMVAQPHKLASILDDAILSPTKGTCQKIYDIIHARLVQEIGHGIRVAPNEGDVCRLTPQGSLFAIFESTPTFGGPPNAFLTLKFVAPGNSIKWHQTTPGLHRDIDPQFVAQFDLEFVIRLHLPTTLSPLGANIGVAAADVRQRNVVVRGENVGGKFAQLMGDVVSVVSYPDLFAQGMMAGSNSVQGEVQAKLNERSTDLNELAAKGFTKVRAEFLPDVEALKLVVSKTAAAVIANGVGVVSGAIYWPVSLGQYAPAAPFSFGRTPCSGLTLRVEAEVAPMEGTVRRMQPVGNFVRRPSPERITSGFTYALAGSQHKCGFEVTDLPVGYPLYVHIGAAGNWRTPSGGPVDIKRLEFNPSNFHNPVTIRQQGPACSAFDRLPYGVRVRRALMVRYCTNAIVNLLFWGQGRWGL